MPSFSQKKDSSDSIDVNEDNTDENVNPSKYIVKTTINKDSFTLNEVNLVNLISSIINSADVYSEIDRIKLSERKFMILAEAIRDPQYKEHGMITDQTWKNY